MDNLAIIGGTGLDTLGILEVHKREVVETPYGSPSGAVARGTLFGKEVLFLPRHGYSHSYAPHKINYRANLWALRELGAENILAIAAVGGIRNDMSPATLSIPDQIIDYTWGRTGTFHESENDQVLHIDFTNPYCEGLRQKLLTSASSANVDVIAGGTYGAVQGPRLETSAEILRMERDGCDIVGMTGMPEAALAREINLCYATCAVVANWAAGKGQNEITMEEIEENLKIGLSDVSNVLKAFVL
ncbi:MAG: S-methyl-5'-thioinosine phosphorylase [Gammaproteobacteria bacterium]|nr:S-methyl-5'-thioinosine phosphorylase [Gammaproteobacteria bacterium]